MWNPPWMFHPKKFWFDGWVDPKHQHHGVGSAIYNMLKDDFNELNAIAAWMGIRENMTESIAFARNRGFSEKMRGWESTIDPGQADTSEFQRYSTKASQAGIEFSTLEQESRDDPDCYPKLYELVQTAFRDVPIADTPTDTPYDQWLAFEMKNPNLIPQAYMIAKDGDKYVGTSVVWGLKKEPRRPYPGLTGGLRGDRGEGIAVALKINGLEFARKNRFDNIITFLA